MRKRHYCASNDALIEEFIRDDRYLIHQNGTIWIRFRNQWRKTGQALTSKGGKIYRHLKYKNKNLVIHRIVYRKFIGALDSSLIINHIDGDSLNNNISNLELITQQENILHAHYA